jgi:hypothetical protein
VVLALPFQGTWLARNSPAVRVPSHGTHFLGQSFAIDFIAVQRGRTASRWDWRTLIGLEPADRFVGFGRPILAPADGRVVVVHDGEADHAARRSLVTLLPYALSQRTRLGRGLAAITGNHVIVALGAEGPYLALVHLRAGSVRVRQGDAVTVGQQIAECGNSGNSTQPHLHIQVMDSLDLLAARGVPIAFRDYRDWARGTGAPVKVGLGMPGSGDTVEPLARGS